MPRERTVCLKKWPVTAIVALGLLLGPIAASAQYDFRQVDLPGYPGSNFGGINDSGDAVGNSGSVDGIEVGPNNAPYIYGSMDGTITKVTPASGYLSTSLVGINDAGVTVGSVLGFDGFSKSGVIRSKDGEYTVIEHPDAVTETVARAINNKGLVTGIYRRADDTYGGFVYEIDTGTFTELVPSFLTIPHGINSRGTIVGDARFEVDPCGGQGTPLSRYGWVRDRDGSIVLFQINGQNTRVRGISDAGFITGAVSDPLTGGIKGFVIKAPKTNCQPISIASDDLLQPAGAFAVFPEGITNSGDVVGLFFDDSGHHGFIATTQ